MVCVEVSLVFFEMRPLTSVDDLETKTLRETSFPVGALIAVSEITNEEAGATDGDAQTVVNQSSHGTLSRLRHALHLAIQRSRFGSRLALARWCVGVSSQALLCPQFRRLQLAHPSPRTVERRASV